MADDRRVEAIKSIQGLWSTSIAVSVIWLLFIPSAIEQLKLYNAAIHLTAWKVLSDVTKGLPQGGDKSYLLRGWVKNDPQTGFVGEGPPSYDYPLLGPVCQDFPGDEDTMPGRSCSPLVINATWPKQASIVVFLSTDLLSKDDGFDGERWTPQRPGSAMNHFRVVTTFSDLPFNSYLVTREGGLAANEPDEYLVSNVADEWTKTGLKEWPIHKLRLYARPLFWSEIASYLGVQRMSDISDDQLRDFQRRADPSQSSVEIGGLKISALYAVPAIGLVLAALAIVLLGPLTALTQDGEANNSSVWIMAINTRNHSALEILITVMSLVWVALPVALGIVQLSVDVPLPAGLRILRWLSTLSLLSTAVIFWRCAFALHSIRRRRSK